MTLESSDKQQVDSGPPAGGLNTLLRSGLGPLGLSPFVKHLIQDLDKGSLVKQALAQHQLLRDQPLLLPSSGLANAEAAEIDLHKRLANAEHELAVQTRAHQQVVSQLSSENLVLAHGSAATKNQVDALTRQVDLLQQQVTSLQAAGWFLFLQLRPLQRQAAASGSDTAFSEEERALMQQLQQWLTNLNRQGAGAASGSQDSALYEQLLSHVAALGGAPAETPSEAAGQPLLLEAPAGRPRTPDPADKTAAGEAGDSNTSSPAPAATMAGPGSPSSPEGPLVEAIVQLRLHNNGSHLSALCDGNGKEAGVAKQLQLQEMGLALPLPTVITVHEAAEDEEAVRKAVETIFSNILASSKEGGAAKAAVPAVHEETTSVRKPSVVGRALGALSSVAQSLMGSVASKPPTSPTKPSSAAEKEDPAAAQAVKALVSRALAAVVAANSVPAAAEDPAAAQVVHTVVGNAVAAVVAANSKPATAAAVVQEELVAAKAEVEKAVDGAVAAVDGAVAAVAVAGSQAVDAAKATAADVTKKVEIAAAAHVQSAAAVVAQASSAVQAVAAAATPSAPSAPPAQQQRAAAPPAKQQAQQKPSGLFACCFGGSA